MVAKIENLVHYMLNYNDGDMLCLGVRFFDRTAYNKAVEYLEKTKTSYKVASDMGVIDDICDRLGLERRVIYPDEYYLEKSKRYNSSEELYNKNRKLYYVIHQRGLLATVFPQSRKPCTRTDEELLSIAANYRTSKELKKSNSNVYNLLQRRKLLPLWKEMIEKQESKVQ